MSPSGNWPHLPPDLLRVILTDITTLPDYLRFRAVCSNWRGAAPLTKHHLPREFPWLMLPITTPNLRDFFNPLTKDTHRINLPEYSESQRRAGSSFGWLVLIENSPSIFLINPLTRSIITLPPITSFPNVSKFDKAKLRMEYTVPYPGNKLYCRSSTHMRDYLIKKVVLSNSPSNESDFVAFAILNEFGQLAYCRKGDDSWKIIDGVRHYCEDAIFFSGSFYAVNNYGQIAICDVNKSNPEVNFICTPMAFDGASLYLVDAMGELLLVTRYTDSEIDIEESYELCKTVKFYVYCLDVVGEEWVGVQNLGDKMLFLGDNSSFALSSDDYPGCEGNVIYFTDDYSSDGRDGIVGAMDVGIYNLEDERVESLPCYPRSSHRPIWMTPNLF